MNTVGLVFTIVFAIIGVGACLCALSLGGKNYDGEGVTKAGEWYSWHVGGILVCASFSFLCMLAYAYLWLLY